MFQPVLMKFAPIVFAFTGARDTKGIKDNLEIVLHTEAILMRGHNIWFY